MVVVTTTARMILVFCLVQMTALAFAVDAPDRTETSPVTHMVVAANPHASRTGMDMLLAGGSAADAAVAIELVLSLVEPQSSGIGGGAFMLYYDAAAEPTNRIKAYDGRETAPQQIGPNLFEGVEKSRAGYMDASLGGRSTGTPGALSMLYLVHQKHGKLPWKNLFQNAIELAENGFSISPRLHFLLDRDPLLRKVPGSYRYFYDEEGKARAVGHVLKNPEYAHTLKLIAVQGPKVFYQGEIAKKILASVHGSVKNPGKLSMSDMIGYKSKIREPVCAPYRSFTICSMSPPSSGGITVSAILGILESFDLAAMSADDPKAIHLVLEAEKLAYADRDYYVADPDFVNVPQDGMLNKAYLQSRASLIDFDKTMGRAAHGTPPFAPTVSNYIEGFTPELPSTSHFSIVDQWGNVVAMTASVGNAFGNRHMAAGFMLNNELTDFTFFGINSEILPANAPAGGKRPRSSMAPTIVLDEQDRPVLVIGTAGGSSIIAFVAQSIINVLDWKMSVEEAVNTPHFLSRNGPVILERDTAAHALMAPLTAMGHDVEERTVNSGLHGIRIRYGKDGIELEGGADKRREGLVLVQ